MNYQEFDKPKLKFVWTNKGTSLNEIYTKYWKLFLKSGLCKQATFQRVARFYKQMLYKLQLFCDWSGRIYKFKTWH